MYDNYVKLKYTRNIYIKLIHIFAYKYKIQIIN